jgi:hypothetical protein
MHTLCLASREMFKRRAGWQHDTTVRRMFPLKTWKHGLSDGPQRQFKVDHPTDGHTQEGFGCGGRDRRRHKLDSEGDRTITPNSLRCSLASMLDRRAPMSPWRPTTERADRFSRSTSSASGTCRWLRSNPLLPVTRRTTCNTSHKARQSLCMPR